MYRQFKVIPEVTDVDLTISMLCKNRIMLTTMNDPLVLQPF